MSPLEFRFYNIRKSALIRIFEYKEMLIRSQSEISYSFAFV